MTAFSAPRVRRALITVLCAFVAAHQIVRALEADEINDDKIKMLGLRFVTIPAGTFQMGCSPGDSECSGSESPAHSVRITKGFDLMVTPVTVKQFAIWAKAAGRDQLPQQRSWSADDVPVANVTWDESRTFCSFFGGRLPTEAEWEYAARGGSGSARYGLLDDIAWYGDNSGDSRIDTDALAKQSRSLAAFVEAQKANGNRAHPVGTKAPNAFGLFDMLGNVWQWTADWYGLDYYKERVEVDPKGPASGNDRVLRGGSWANGSRFGRASSRYWVKPTDRVADNGFRCVRDAHSP